MRYFIGFLITVGLIAILIVLLFGGGNKKPLSRVKPLPEYASTDAQVSLSIDGPINAASQHQQVKITVDSNNVLFEHFTGYDGNVADTQIYSNSQNAYDAFLHALQHAEFMRSSNKPELKNESGYCPLGNRYVFELVQNDQTLQRSWATSCGNPRTYEGLLDLTLTLFQRQVPDYTQLTQNITDL